MGLRVFAALALAFAVSLTTALSGAHRNFIPDWTFTGSALTGWQPLGQADWRAVNGEIIATPRTADGGWLMLDQSFQDVQVAASVRCAAACRPGLLIRAQRLADGTIRGILVSYAPGDMGAYAVTIDAQGAITSRDKLRPGGGQARFVANPDGTAPYVNAPVSAPATSTPPGSGATAGRPGPAAAPGAGGPGAPGGGRVRAGMPDGIPTPYPAPVYEFKAADWNDLEVQVDANILRGWLNDGPEPGVANGAADEDRGRYGPVALYVGGEGEVRFKAIGVKDLGRHVWPTEQVGSRFTMLRLSNFSYGWSTTVADINRDGHPDIVAGPWYFLGPDFTVSREIALTRTWNPSNEYPNGLQLQHAADFTGDGWPDVLMATNLYVNPGTEQRRWDRVATGMMGGGEVTAYRDVDGDGRPDVVNSNGAGVSFSHPDPANPMGPWISTNVSGPGPWPAHGVGAGDINGDGKVDLLNPYGWWEQPAGGASQTSWKYHPMKVAGWGRAGGGPGGAEIYVYDVNGDGKNDIVTSLQAHGWGLGWLEQKRNPSGDISFEPHTIMGDYSAKNPGNVTFSELHGLTIGDVDGDRIPDIVTGKRWGAHQESYVDPDPAGVPVVYVFRTVRNPVAPGGAEFVPELVHNRSGVGSSVLAADVNKDGTIDIVTATKLGIFAFLNTPRRAAIK